MPTYVYRFIDTGETIEIRQSFDDAPLTEAPHPSDGKPRPVKKVFTPVGITFKGSGFYKTDSGSGTKSTKSDRSGSDKGTSAGDAAPSGSSAPASNAGSASSGSSTGSTGTAGGATSTSTSSG
jgi:predicted nucleic acid-binding Zn ribbon protein